MYQNIWYQKNKNTVQSPSSGLLKRKLRIEKIQNPKPNPQIQNTNVFDIMPLSSACGASVPSDAAYTA